MNDILRSVPLDWIQDWIMPIAIATLVMQLIILWLTVRNKAKITKASNDEAVT